MTFFFDNCMPIGLCEILKIAEEDVRHVQDIWPECDFPNGVEDTVWIPYVGERQWIVITADTHLTTRPSEIIALMKAKVITYIAYPRFTSAGIRQQVRWLFKSWECIEDHLSKTAAKGHVYEVRSDGKIGEKHLRSEFRNAMK